MTHDSHHGAPNRGDARATAAAPDASGGFTHRQVMTILAGLLLGMFLASLDQTVVSTATRTVADDLNGYHLQAWATTAFLITSTIANPFYGKLSDLYGRRPFYLFAIGVFIVGSMLCGLATSMYELAAFRAIQGIGAGGLMSLAMVIVGDIVPPRERSKYQGYFMAVFGSSSVLGPVIGGALAGQESILGITGWRWIFYVNVPIGLLALVTVMKVLHLPHTRREHRIDFPGALALIICLVPLLLVAEQGRIWGWDSGRSLLCYTVGAVGLVAFVVAERVYKDDALLPLRLFGNRTFTVTSMGSVAVGAGMFGGILLLPQYLQIVHGSSPTLAGLQMIPLVLGIMTASIVAGQTIARTGKYRLFPMVGAVFIVVALVSMSFIISGSTHWRTLAPFMVLLGLGLGCNFQPVILAVQNAVSPREIGVATSSVTFFRQMGGTIGTAAFLSIMFSSLTGKIADAHAAARGTAAFQRAAAAHPDQLQTLQNLGGGNSGDSFGDTSFIQRLDPALAAPLKTGFADSIDLVFLVAACVVAIGFVVLIFLPQLTLRNQSGFQAAAQQAAAGRPTGATPPRDTAGAGGAAAPMSVASTQPAGAGTPGGRTGIPEQVFVPEAAPHGAPRPGVVKRALACAIGLLHLGARCTSTLGGAVGRQDARRPSATWLSGRFQSPLPLLAGAVLVGAVSLPLALGFSASTALFGLSVLIVCWAALAFLRFLWSEGARGPRHLVERALVSAVALAVLAGVVAVVENPQEPSTDGDAAESAPGQQNPQVPGSVGALPPGDTSDDSPSAAGARPGSAPDAPFALPLELATAAGGEPAVSHGASGCTFRVQPCRSMKASQRRLRGRKR